MNALGGQKAAPDGPRPPRPRPPKLLPLCFVSEATRTDAKRLFDLLAARSDLTPADLDEMKRLLDDGPRNRGDSRGEAARGEGRGGRGGAGDVRGDGSSLFSVVNWDGFTLLQRAVMRNHVGAARLMLKKGADVNAGICSLPLHLACRLGHAQMAQVLLTHGARADLECTVCFPPEDHKLKTCPDQIHCLAYQPVQTPILYALCGDHDTLLPLLISHENSRSLVRTEQLLHEACRMGARACALFLLQQYPEQLAQENSAGRTPLQISLVRDADAASFLAAHGAKLGAGVFLTADTGSTLHELYKSKTSLGLVKATKFAVENGFRSHINARDQDGNTALHVLLRHVGRTVRRGAVQSDYDREVRESVTLLLHHGSNPNIPNHVGETALHAALADNAARQLYVSRHGQVRRLKAILQEIHAVAEILLAHGADAGQRSMAPACVSPLCYAARVFQALRPEMFVVVQAALLRLLQLLSRDACTINAPDACGLTVYAQLLNTARRWINGGVGGAFARAVMSFLSAVLSEFVQGGLDANSALHYWTPRVDETVESNYFKEILLFTNLQVQDVCFYDDVRRLLLKLVQHGGNPSLLTFDPPPAPPPTVPRLDSVDGGAESCGATGGASGAQASEAGGGATGGLNQGSSGAATRGPSHAASTSRRAWVGGAGGARRSVPLCPVVPQRDAMPSVAPRGASIGLILVRALHPAPPPATGHPSLIEGQAATPAPPPPAVTGILRVLCHTLSQSKLNELSLALVRIHAVQHGAAAELSEPVCTELHRLAAPRTLRQMARISIAQSLGWKLARHCSGGQGEGGAKPPLSPPPKPSLPLPGSLLQYVHDVDV